MKEYTRAYMQIYVACYAAEIHTPGPAEIYWNTDL